MKTKIKVLVKEDICSPQVIDGGDWIDLKSAEDVEYIAPQAGREHTVKGVKQRNVSNYNKLVSLGICVKLPKGYEAIVAPRSSSYGKFGFMQTNSIGVIDNSYCGNNDVWKLPIISMKTGTIHKGDRIAQFRVQLSQKATIWQRLKWLFTSGVEIKYVSSLDDTNRGGFGSTGVK